MVQGKNIVSDGPSPPSVQPPEEEELFPTPFPHIPVGGRLAHFLNQWQLITSDKWAPSILRGGGGGGSGTSVPESTSIVISSSNMSVTRDPDRNLFLQEEVHTLLQKGAVELVNPPLTPGFYSHLFLVPEKNGKTIPVIDLSILNQHLIVPNFKMETNRSIRGSIHLGMWTTSLDLTDGYFHIPISPKFLRFVWEDRVYTLSRRCLLAYLQPF